MSRRAAVVTGVAVLGAYVAGAALSGHLSPLARRPLLDGLVPPAPYRWVEPPPELAGRNVAPSPESFRVALDDGGSETAVLTTGDAQLTLILPEGAFAAADGQRAVGVRVEPVGASAAGAPPAPTTILGNVYVVRAAYQPSGEPAELGAEARAVLVYPLLTNDHGGHEVLVSPDGAAWTALETNDLPSVQQADAAITSFGHLAVGGSVASPTAAPEGEEDGGSAIPAVAIGAGLVVLAIGAAVALLPRGANRPGRGAGTGSRRARNRSGSRSTRTD
ncbi:MAG: hypothetical protein ACXWYC_09355 [Actinomycetota bacterium]